METCGIRISVNNIHKCFGSLEVIRGVSLSVATGEIVCILGPSGCGKTTLLRIIAKLIKQDSGLASTTGTIGMVFQELRLLDWRTVGGNLEIPYLLCSKKVDENRVRGLLRVAELSDFIDYYPSKLSIGMQQRLSISRAVVLDPDILLLDEPFRGLDVKIRETLEDDILNIHHLESQSILFVTHSIDEAVRVADRIVIVSKRPMEVLESIKVPSDRKPRPIYSEDLLNLKKRIYNILDNDYNGQNSG